MSVICLQAIYLHTFQERNALQAKYIVLLLKKDKDQPGLVSLG